MNRNQCLATECLQQAYRDRLAALQNISVRHQPRIRLPKETTEPIIYYGDLRKNIKVGEMQKFPWRQRSRPKGFFQLAGSKNNQLCAEVLAVFNEPGSYVGNDLDRWLTDNSKKVQFHALSDPEKYNNSLYQPLEYASVDIDGDGKQEYVYRWGDIDGGWGPLGQDKIIYDNPLHEQKAAMKAAEKECLERWANRTYTNPDASELCKNDLIRNRAEFGGWPHWKLVDSVNEWNPQITKFIQETKLPLGILGFVENPRDYCDSLRNVGHEYRSLWDFYRLPSATVLVVKPLYLELPTPPEYLVFFATRDTARLQCIIIPRTWYKSNDSRPCNK